MMSTQKEGKELGTFTDTGCFIVCVPLSIIIIIFPLIVSISKLFYIKLTLMLQNFICHTHSMIINHYSYLMLPGNREISFDKYST